MTRENHEVEELIVRAKLGSKECLDQLAHRVEPRLRAFIYRSVLDRELTDDLVQEVLLQMVKSLADLHKVQSFWPWIFRIASNKISQFFRVRGRASEVQFSTLGDFLLESISRDDAEERSSSAVGRELSQRIFEAIADLKYRQRAIVSLRCFEGMSYSQIAESVGCTEAHARVSFFRAKHSLKKQLTRRGFSRTSLLSALVLFGKLTAPSEAAAAAVTVSPASLGGIGLPAGVVRLVRPRWVKIAASVVFCTAIICLYFWPESVLNRADVKFVHFTVQGVMAGGGSSSSSSSGGGTSTATAGNERALRSQGAYETWLYFPEGPDGPVIRRDQRWNIKQTGKLCSWLQDGKANYYYHAGQRIVYMTNKPLNLLLLPTDPPCFAEFILDIYGQNPDVEYIYNERTGLLNGKIDNRVPSVKNFETTYEYNNLQRSIFDYDWSNETKVIDQRDEMHKRGWTYFRVTGHVGEDTISGQGRIPLVYEALKKYQPWLCLKIGEALSIVDSSKGAFILDGSGNVLASFQGGTFFRGLARPWMGICAYDIVRRDAAEKRIEFECTTAGKGGRVTLHKEEGYSRTIVDYSIDMRRDVLERIAFQTSGGPKPREGDITFYYPDGTEQSAEEFVEPAPLACTLPVQQETGVCWLFELAEGSLGQLQVNRTSRE